MHSRFVEVERPSDPHWYPDQDDIGLDALCSVIRDIKPKAVLCGGDALDGTQIGRWEPTRGWHAPPDLVEQLDAMVESMNRIKTAAGKHTPTFMTLGNHDARFSRYIAEHAPHLEHLPGTRLEDYIPAWPLSWTVEINGNTVLRHRPLKSGANAPYQSTLHSGWHSFNGHLHNAQIRIVPRFKHYQFGGDVGSLANPQSDAFDYAENGIPWVQAFAVLTYAKGDLIDAELVKRRGDRMIWRGAPV